MDYILAYLVIVKLPRKSLITVDFDGVVKAPLIACFVCLSVTIPVIAYVFKQTKINYVINRMRIDVI